MSERTGYPQGTPCWADIWTDDPAAGRAFYAGLFGWEWEVSPDPAFGGYSIALLRGKRVVGLSGTMIPDMRPAWVTYLAVDDADAFAAAVPAAGGTVAGPPMDIADQGRMALATDPAGAFFGVWQRGVHTGSELVNEPGTVVWNELVAADLVPLAGRRDLCRAERVDAQADRRAPRHGILDERDLLAVVREQERARALQALLGLDFLVGFHVELGAHRAVWPDDTHDVRMRLLA